MEQNVNRRRFLGAAIGTGAAAAMAPSALAHGRHGRSERAANAGSSVPRNRRGIQLYTMREKMKNQAQARDVLRFLGRNGYTEVETAGHYDWTAAQFRAELKAAGLKARLGARRPGLHLPAPSWQDAYRTTLEYAAALGQKYTGWAWFPGPYNDVNVWKGLADKFNEAGALAREYDLQFFYHNHNFEFENKQADGSAGLRHPARGDRPRGSSSSSSTCSGSPRAARTASSTSRPTRRGTSRTTSRTTSGATGPTPTTSRTPGPGMLDFPDLFAAGDARGLDKHFFIEHDAPWLSHPDDPEAEFKTAKAGIQYLESVRW